MLNDHAVADGVALTPEDAANVVPLLPMTPSGLVRPLDAPAVVAMVLNELAAADGVTLTVGIAVSIAPLLPTTFLGLVRPLDAPAVAAAAPNPRPTAQR